MLGLITGGLTGEKGATLLVSDLMDILERLAPAGLAESWDNSGLSVGDEKTAVRRILAALELTEPVLDEALANGCDTVLTHHPFLFTPVRSLVESRGREHLLRRLVREHVTLIACHTNLDSAAGGIAELAGSALGLQWMAPLELAGAGWCKLVGFVPREAVDTVAAAVFAAGGGGIGNYKDCAFAAEGTGWFTPLAGSDPAVGQVARPERTPEVRWETVVPKARLGAAVRAFIGAHPYEEPAFDIYPVEDRLTRVGIGRVGALPKPVALRALVEQVVKTFEVSRVAWSGDGERRVARVGLVPGSGRSFMDAAAGQCDVYISGEFGHHDPDEAAEKGLSLIDVPHGEFEWWAFKRWTAALAGELSEQGVSVSVSKEWRPQWQQTVNEAGVAVCRDDSTSAAPVAAGARAETGVRVRVDGGSRGNPGPSAIGVVLEDQEGMVLQTVGRVIGVATNNVAEYRALLTGLELAKARGAAEVEVVSDSELLVKQMRGEYKVKNEGLQALHLEARRKVAEFSRFSIRHVLRKENAGADALVNQALDEQERAGL